MCCPPQQTPGGTMSDTPLTKIQLRVITFMYKYPGLTIAHQLKYGSYRFNDTTADGDHMDFKPADVEIFKPLYRTGPGKIITSNLYKKGYLVIVRSTERWTIYKLNPLVIEALASLIDPKTCCAPGSCPNDPEISLETNPPDCSGCSDWK